MVFQVFCEYCDGRTLPIFLVMSHVTPNSHITQRKVDGDGAEDKVFAVNIDGFVCPEVLEGSHFRQGLGYSLFDVKVISEKVRDEVSEVFEVLSKGDDAAVW